MISFVRRRRFLYGILQTAHITLCTSVLNPSVSIARRDKSKPVCIIGCIIPVCAVMIRIRSPERT